MVKQKYDLHAHYPAQPGEPCVNKEMCEYVWWQTDFFIKIKSSLEPPYEWLEPETSNGCLGTVKYVDLYK